MINITSEDKKIERNNAYKERKKERKKETKTSSYFLIAI